MSFYSLTFLFCFLPVSLLLYYLLPKRFANVFLVVVSLLFYSWGSPYGIFLLLGLAIFDYYVSFYLKKGDKKYRFCLLVILISLHVFILFYFKYYFQLLSIIDTNIYSLQFEVFGMPLGLSYYTFTLISYLVDVYSNRITNKVSFINYLIYICFFPKLLMGPIMYYEDMEKQFGYHTFSLESFNIGSRRIIIGLFVKVVLADTLAIMFANLYQLPYTFVGSWLMTITFALQLYFDFSGYSHIAIGLGNLFGFRLSENFNYPYLSTSLKEFWGRWHITLGAFFKRYVYIPLKGSRAGISRTVLNIMVVWCLTGLWHGNSFNYLLWGVFLGIMLIIEKFFYHKIQIKLPKLINWFITMIIIMISWVFFYSDTSNILSILGSMFGGCEFVSSQVLFILKSYKWYILIGILVATPLLNSIEVLCNYYFNKSYYLISTVLYFMLFIICIAFIVSGSYQAFMYAAF